MDTIGNYPFYPLEITKDGKIFSAQQKTAIEDAVRQTGAGKLTDLFVISHGWNNDMQDARELYDRLFTNVAKILAAHPLPGNSRQLAIVGVFWPSKKFAEEDLIPAGGAASMGAASAGGQQLSASALKLKLEDLKGTFDRSDEDALERAKALVDELEDKPSAQKKFVDLIRSVLPQNPSDTTEDASDHFLRKSGDELLKALAAPAMPGPASSTQGGALSLDADEQVGAAAGIGDIFSGIKAAAWRLLNYATYYQMKERAGLVGGGLNSMLKDVRQLRTDLRIHLIGHSFGARVVTAAVDGPAPLRPSSLALLQGAFSHNGFTEKFDHATDGFFRKVISQNKVDGPIIATHTVNDRAVGIAYPLASRISGDNRLALGDENDVFGGIGRNGAVKMKPTEFVKGRLLPANGSYAFVRAKVHNLVADQFISGHSDVTNPQVANAIVQVAAG